jgi:hypothetical protein
MEGQLDILQGAQCDIQHVSMPISDRFDRMPLIILCDDHSVHHGLRVYTASTSASALTLSQKSSKDDSET